MGSKGGGDTTPTYTPPVQQVDYSPMFSMMTEAMIAAMSLMQPTTSPPPDVYEAPTVDWGEKQEEIAADASKTTIDDLKRKRGRSSTVLTGPLVNEEDPDTVSKKAGGA